MNIGIVLGEVNWSNITSNWGTYFMTGYDHVFGHWTYPLIFLGVIGYVYCVSRSAMVAAASICLIFGIYGATSIFRYPDIPEFSMLGWVIVIVSFAGLFTTLFVSKRRG